MIEKPKLERCFVVVKDNVSADIGYTQESVKAWAAFVYQRYCEGRDIAPELKEVAGFKP